MLIGNAAADVRLSDSFSYADGNLVGQGSWTQTGATATSPIQVASGQASLGTSGQDIFKGLTSTVTATAGTSMFTAFDFTVSAAQATGDYFLHVSDPLATTTGFYQRFFARSSGGGFQLGLLDTSGTGSATTWGATVLTLGNTYTAVVSWDFASGANNDTFQLYLDPTDPVEGNNPTYLTHTWTSTSVLEPAQLAAANLRQGTAGNSATVLVDNLVVATQFADLIPEPSSLALLGLAGLALLRRRRV